MSTKRQHKMINKITLIGSNGFIGKAIQRISHPDCIECYSHSSGPNKKKFDLNDQKTWAELIGNGPERAILLAWPGLDDYHSFTHITQNLPNAVNLVKRLIDKGLKELVVAGTCYEYGKRDGCMSPNAATFPINMYGIAKDSLNRALSMICSQSNTRYCWVRIFFPYGKDQRQSSLVPSLISAARSGEKTFDLGPSDLIRDFIPVDQAAYRLLQLIQNEDAHGNYNCGTGTPISLRSFVEKLISKHSLEIEPIFNVKPQRPSEPLASWANMENWASIKKIKGGLVLRSSVELRNYDWT